MVGYHKHDSLTTRQKLVAGVVSGVVTRFITQPLDIVKLRTQLQKQSVTTKRKGITKTAKRILVEEGFTAFWHGHILGQLHSILAVSSQFYVYELTTKMVAKLDHDKGHVPYIRFICGVLAGCVSATLVIPLEVIRVRQMIVKDQYKGLLNGAKAVYRYGGIIAFYEGLGASLLQMGPQVGISFVVFSYTQPWIIHHLEGCVGTQCDHHENDEAPLNKSHSANRYSPQNLLIASSVAGSVAGFVSKSSTYPFDLAKRRLQVGSHRPNKEKYQTPSTSRNLIQCKTLTECLKKTFQKEGIMGLFRGWSVTIWKAQVTSVVAFTSYEMICYLVREMNARNT